MSEYKYPYRYLARIIIEAVTPLAVGSGDRDVTTDSLVATDVNGLPFIPGTALAGVLRHSLQIDETNKDDIFGSQKENKGTGSRLILSSAHIVAGEGKVIDSLQPDIVKGDDFLRHLKTLPIRQHVRITHTGVSQEGGKFDEQVVYKGTRFCFEMEFIGNEADNDVWRQILNEFSHPAFRIGGGTRRGFGEIKVVECKSKIVDLREDLDSYLHKTSSLIDENRWWENVESKADQNVSEIPDCITYELALKPDDFFLFGSGFGNDDADMTFVTETVIEWNDDKPIFTKEKVLVPAASVKGALAHRTAYHFNRAEGVFADTISPDSISELCKKGYWLHFNCEKFDSNKNEDLIKMVTLCNPAVNEIFGYQTGDKDEKNGKRGNAIFSDIFLEPAGKKLLNHVAIDRFTGGAIDGALFSEEVAQSGETLEMKIVLINKMGMKDEYILAFESALADLCNGSLPLGGGTMRGHGCFTGKCLKDGQPIIQNTTDYEQ